jgi:hypothetical protein
VVHWGYIKEKIQDSYNTIESAYNNYVESKVDQVKKRPVLNNAVKIALNAIPVVGPTLRDLYDNIGGSEEDKTKQILNFLIKLEQQNKEDFERIAEDLKANKDIIIENITNNRIALTDLISKSVLQILKEVGKIGQNTVHLSDGLLVLINQSRKSCEEIDIPFRTPNLLLPLFRVSSSLAKRSLDKIQANLGQGYEDALISYIVNMQPKLERGNKYVPFDWYEREDVRLAQAEAFNEGYPVVTEKHLLLGILQSNSKTSKEIRDQLGENKFHHLLEIVREEHPQTSSSTTPGSIMTQNSGRNMP